MAAMSGRQRMEGRKEASKGGRWRWCTGATGHQMPDGEARWKGKVGAELAEGSRQAGGEREPRREMEWRGEGGEGRAVAQWAELSGASVLRLSPLLGFRLPPACVVPSVVPLGALPRSHLKPV